MGQEHDADVVVVVVDTPQQGGHLPPDDIASQYHLPAKERFNNIELASLYEISIGWLGNCPDVASESTEITDLRHMESVARLLLLWLLLVHGVHLVLLGTATWEMKWIHIVERLFHQILTCIRRSLTKVLRRTGTSLLSRRVSGEPAKIPILTCCP